MTYRADGTAVVSVVDGETSGVALAFDPNMAGHIAEALNKHMPRGSRNKVDPLTGETVDQLDVNDDRMLSDVLDKGKFVKIVGPYATAVMGTTDGRQVRSLAEGSVLPGDVTAGQARHLISVGLAQVVEGKSAAEVSEGAPTQVSREAQAAAAGVPPAPPPAETGDKAPAGNASRDAWAAWAAKSGAPDEDTQPEKDGGLSRDQLREKYGS